MSQKLSTPGGSIGFRTASDRAKKLFWQYRMWFSTAVFTLAIVLLLFNEAIEAVSGIAVPSQLSISLLIVYVIFYLQVLSEQTSSDHSKTTTHLDDLQSETTARLEEIRNQLNPSIVFVGGPDAENSSTPQDTTNDYLKQYVQRNHPNRIDMLEYSSMTIQPLLQTATDADSEVRLLLKRPKSAGPDRQPGFIRSGINELYMRYQTCDNISIRLYDENASLRGRKTDDGLVNVGWYTYDHRDDGRDPQLWGCQNAQIIVQDDHPEEYTALSQLFQTVFQNVWDNAVTLQEAYAYDEDPYVIDWMHDGDTAQKEEWLDRVSG